LEDDIRIELGEIEFGNHDSSGPESGLMAGFLNTFH
jgi:hypothetical protein